MTNKMKIVSFFPFLSVIAVCMPAYAVDYVACREMLRTKNEMILKAQEIEKNYQNITIPQKRQQFLYTTQVPEHIMSIGCPKNDYKEEITEKSDILSKYEWCRVHFKTDYVAKLWVEEEKKLSQENISLEAKKWIKAANKVQADMKKADCPYE